MPPQYPPPSYPTTTPTSGLLGALMGDAADAVASFTANAVDDPAARRWCGGWKSDGLYEHKLCCTPSVGRMGVKVAACIKVSRPVDPWTVQVTPPLGVPTWPAPM